MTSDEDRMLAKLVRAMMAYYGPIQLIRATIVEADAVIEEMAVAGHIKEAKNFAQVMCTVREALLPDREAPLQPDV